MNTVVKSSNVGYFGAFPTRTDFEFWQSKRPFPGWAASFASAPTALSIDEVVNSRSGLLPRRYRERDAHDLAGFVRSARRRGGDKEVLGTLDRVGSDTEPRFKGRAAMARRWAARLRSA